MDIKNLTDYWELAKKLLAKYWESTKKLTGLL